MDFTKQTYCNQVTSYIRSLIRKGTLEIGAPVKEAVLSEQLGISRAPIREALQVLVQEGLITSEPQKGKHVRQMTGKEIYDSYVVAGILEGAGVAESLPLWTEANMETFRSADRHHAVAEAVYSRDVKHVETALRDHYKETGLRMAQFGKEA